jgi:ferredoxin
MTEDVYRRLQQRLDDYSIGFPAAESGLDQKILQRLFDPEEADMYLDLTLLLETPDQIAARTGRELGQLTELLERMVDKGLIFRLKREETKYAASPYVVGVFEFQVKDLDPELADMMEQYYEEAFHRSFVESGSFMRPIPINRQVVVSHPVATYEDSRQIVRGHKKLAVAQCICRVQQKLIGKGCDRPVEICMMFGSHADYYVDKGMARYIDVEEADRLLDLCEKEGLVTQPYNTVNPGGMCNCCGCCCGVLRGIKNAPKPAELVLSNYWAEIDADACTACETCLERCQMDAIRMEDETAVVDLDRCIGCGLCVTTCPADAVTLMVKPESQRRTPPENGVEQMLQMAERRGKSLIPEG